MKILIAADLHWPTINGVATFSRNLAHGLADAGHEVVVVAPSQTGKKSVEVDGNYTIYRTRSTVFRLYQNFRISLTPHLEVRKIIQDFQPDIIHIQMVLGIGQAALQLGRRADIPVVATSHAMPENLMENLKRAAILSRPISYILANYGRRFYSKCDALTTPTQSVIDMYADHTEKIMNRSPIHVISNGIDLSAYHPRQVPEEFYEKFGLPKDTPIATYIGRVDAEKHLWVFIEAIEQVLETRPVHGLIVGSGVDLKPLKRLVEKRQLEDHVTFTGYIEDDDKLVLESIGQVFCMPSPAELQSIATLEAMASGQPVVAVRAGALPELCRDGENGYSFSRDDASGMAEGITKILDDPELREQFAKRSLEIADTHELSHSIQRFVQLYEEIIQAKELERQTRPANWRELFLENDFVEYLKSMRDNAESPVDVIDEETVERAQHPANKR